MTHICVGNLTIIGSDSGPASSRRQAIIWTNVEILSIRPLGTNFSEISFEIHTFSFKKMHLERSFCLGLKDDTFVRILICTVCFTWCPMTMNTVCTFVPMSPHIQYIPRNMHTVLLCFALLWLCNRSYWFYMKYLSIFIRVALLALGQSLDCHSASEVSLVDMGKSVNV